MRFLNTAVRTYSGSNRPFLVLFFLFLFASMTGHCLARQMEKSEERIFNLQAGAQLRLLLETGDIRLKTWNQNKLRVQIRKWVEADNEKKAEEKFDQLKIDYEQGRDFLEIRQLKQTNSGLFSTLLKKTGLKSSPSDRIDLTLYAPKNLAVTIEQEKGTTTIDSLQGKLKLKQKQGSLYLNSLALDQMDLKLGHVKAEVKNIRGNTFEKTNVVISAEKGNLILQNNHISKLFFDVQDTDCYLTNNRITDCEIKSKSGDLFLYPVDFSQSQYKIFSKSGDMTLLLPESPDCSVFLETGLGIMRLSHSWNVKKRGSGFFCRVEKTNPTNGRLELITDLGDIYIEKE